MRVKRAVVDFETKPIVPGAPVSPAPVGVALYEGGRARYMSWGHPSGNNCTKQEAKAVLADVCKTQRLVFHNAQFDLRVLRDHFKLYPSKGFDDTKIIAFLLDPTAHSLSLKPLAESVLGMPPSEQEALHDWLREHYPPARRLKDPTKYTAEAPGLLAGRYAKGDVIRTWKLFRSLVTKLDLGEELAYERELAIVPIAIDMERNGIRIDTDRLELDLRKARFRLFSLENQLHKRLGDINLNSGEQLADALERRRLADTFARTPKGRRKTSIEALRAAVKDPELVDMLEERSKLTKIISTYMVPWLESGGRFYPYINTTRSDGEIGGTRTGRFSSNFQQVPKLRFGTLPYMKDYVLAEEGHCIIDRDYSQQELRILAHYESGDLALRYRTFDDMDLHTQVAELMEVERQVAKVCNFLTIYGGGVARLADQLKIEESEARKLREKHMRAIPGVAKLIQRIMDAGEVRTWGGRRYVLEEGFEYKGINILIQGSAADQVKEAMLRAKRVPMLQVHDELLYSVPLYEKEKLDKQIRIAMEDMPGWDVPMPTDVKYGERWGEVR